MIGTMLTIHPRATADVGPSFTSRRTFLRPPGLEEIKAGIGGGFLELVPYFDTIEPENGVVHRCVAFCDEDGERKNLPPNKIATALWAMAMKRKWPTEVNETMEEPLLGSVVVLFGDSEFMASL